MRVDRVPSDPALLPSEPLSLEEAKVACKIFHDAEDELITTLITAAREYAEALTRLTLIPSTWVLWEDRFPCDSRDGIWLPNPPVLEVESIQYRDPDGDWLTVADTDYDVELGADWGVVRHVDAGWPSVKVGSGASVQIRYRAGYGDDEVPHVIPGGIKVGMLAFIVWRFNRRGDEATNRLIEVGVPKTIEMSLWPYRVDL